MQENAHKLVSEAQKSALYIGDNEEPQVVLLSFAEYQKLKDMAEDYLDSKKAQAYKKQDKKKVHWVVHDEVKKLK